MSDHQSIGEVLATLRGDFPDITISKIRFLESQGLIDPERTPSGYRKFRDDDIARLRWILHQQKHNFLPLKVIKSRLDEVGPGELPGDLEPAVIAALADDGAPAAPAPTRASATKATKAAKTTKATRAPRKKATAAGKVAPVAATAPKPARVARPPTAPRFVEPMLPLDDGPEDDLASDPSGASLTRADLAAAVGLDAATLAELEEFGLLIPAAGSGDRVVFDETALVVAKLAAEFAAHGIGPRHLRMFRVFAEREAGLYDQVIAPRLKRKNPEARTQAREDLVDLVRLGRAMRAAFLRDATSGLLTD